MQIKSPNLFVEINHAELIFFAGEIKENDNYDLLHTVKVPLNEAADYKTYNFDLFKKIIKDNIYSFEEKLGCVFNEVFLVLNNFNCTAINLTGFKKLNGSQLGKDNITYILNSLKSKINENEENKTILHIFNSKYILDQKEIKNLPVGLFGNFYSQELSFILIENNYYKNLKILFESCNLKIRKVISKNFLSGTEVINKNENLETFFKIEINQQNIEIFYFENCALKYIESFKYGSNLIIKDVVKITGLNIQVVKDILSSKAFIKQNIENDYIEKDFFDNSNFRKIKKKLIYDIANARIKEIAEIILLKNVNIRCFLKKKLNIFLKIEDLLISKCFEEILNKSFSNKNDFNLKIIENTSILDIYKNAITIVQYGWKKEAVPIVQEKKSRIARIFNLIFR